MIHIDLDILNNSNIDEPEAVALTDDANDNKNNGECPILYVQYILNVNYYMLLNVTLMTLGISIIDVDISMFTIIYIYYTLP